MRCSVISMVQLSSGKNFYMYSVWPSPTLPKFCGFAQWHYTEVDSVIFKVIISITVAIAAAAAAAFMTK